MKSFQVNEQVVVEGLYNFGFQGIWVLDVLENNGINQGLGLCYSFRQGLVIWGLGLEVRGF